MKNILLIKRKLNQSDPLPNQWKNFLVNNKELISYNDNNIALISKVKKSLANETFIFSESELKFYSSHKKKILDLNEISNIYYNYHNKIDEDIKKGKLTPLNDTCFTIYDSKSNKLSIYSSCCGSGTIYYTSSKKRIYFATHTSFLSKLRRFSISKSGVSEIIRFGANYSSQTLLNELFKLPLGCILYLKDELIIGETSYYSQILNSQPISNSLDYILEEIFSSLNLKRASLLFSTGVDSTIIAQKLIGKIDFTSFYMQENSNSNLINNLLNEAEDKGIVIEKYNLNNNIDILKDTITSYSLPTVDFSIIPTHQILNKSLSFSDNILEGTGGDAWFGFSELKNLKYWIILSKFNILSKISSYLLLFLHNRRNTFKIIKYLLSIISRLSIIKRPEISQLACNPYSFSQLKTTSREWELIERRIANTIDELIGKKESNLNRFKVGDACLVAISQFASKTGQSTKRLNCNIHYPFLHPLLIAYAYQLSSSQLHDNNLGYKPLLKKMLLDLDWSSPYVKRKKVGFQPPLKNLLCDKHNRFFIQEILNTEYKELDNFFTTKFLTAVRDNYFLDNLDNIQDLYQVWSYLSIKIWLEDFNS